MGKRRKLKKGKAKHQSRKMISWSVFPSDVEENILSRLPANSLMRLRCVCKHWFNLISKPHFIKMQLNRSTQIKEGSKLVFTSGDKIYSVDVEGYGKKFVKTRAQTKLYMQKELIGLPFGDQYSGTLFGFWGSCNGLICLSSMTSLHLLNPVTKECKRLPFPQILPKTRTSPAHMYALGFGYSPRTDEYKVVMIIHNLIEQSAPDDVWVYTLGTNSSWRSIRGMDCRIYQGQHALVNGALHWIGSATPCSSIIAISFEIGDENFREVSLPKSISHGDTEFIGLVELGGFLSLYHRKSDGNLYIWIMKDYGDELSWTKQFSVPFSLLPVLYGSFKPLCILKKDEVILFKCGIGFYILDVVKKEISDLQHLKHPLNDFGGEGMYFESLVSLGTDRGVDGSNKVISL